MKKTISLSRRNPTLHLVVAIVVLTCISSEFALAGDRSQNEKPKPRASFRALWTKTVPSSRHLRPSLSFVSNQRIAASKGEEERTNVARAHLLLLNAADGTMTKDIELNSPAWLYNPLTVVSVAGNRFLVEYGEELRLFDTETGVQVGKRVLKYPFKDDVWRLFAVPGASSAVLLFSPHGLGHARTLHWIGTDDLEDSGSDSIDYKFECLSATSRFLACVPNPLSGVWLQQKGVKEPRILCSGCFGRVAFLNESLLAIDQTKKGAALAVYSTEGVLLWTRQFGRNRMLRLVSTAPSAGRLLLWVGSKWLEPNDTQDLLLLDASTGATVAGAVFAPRWINEVGRQVAHSYKESSEAALSPDGSKVAVRIGNELTVYTIE